MTILKALPETIRPPDYKYIRTQKTLYNFYCDRQVAIELKLALSSQASALDVWFEDISGAESVRWQYVLYYKSLIDDRMTRRVFLSYSSKDAAAAQMACKALERGGVPVWMAPRNIAIGETWADAIPKAIREARAVVLIYSSHVNQSKFVPLEIQKAFSAGVPIIPVRLEDAAPAGSLDLIVSAFQWLDCFPPPFDRHLDLLVKETKSLLGLNGAAPPQPASGSSLQKKPAEALGPRPPALVDDVAINPMPVQRSRWTRTTKLVAATALIVIVVVGAIMSWSDGQQTGPADGPSGAARAGSACTGSACPGSTISSRSTVPGFDDMISGPYEVIDAATLRVNNQYVSLAKVGSPAPGATPKLARWMLLTGNSVLCRPSGEARYRCSIGSASQYDVSQYVLAEKLAAPLAAKGER